MGLGVKLVAFPFPRLYITVSKEIARLKHELRDAQDALDVLKKAISILGKS